MPRCQLLFVEEYDDGVLIDLLPFEPMLNDGELVPAGCPVPVGVFVADSAAKHDMAATLGRWVDESSGEFCFEVLDPPDAGGPRYVLVHEHEVMLLAMHE